MTYSSSQAMNRQRFANRNQNTAVFAQDARKLGPISNTIILVVLLCLLGLLYLTQVTKTNAYGYKLNSLQTEAVTLKEEQAELEVAAARLQSLERVKASPEANNLVSVAPVASLQN